MAITYHAGRRIQGLSTDYNTTPTETNDFSTTATESKSGSSISIHGGVLGGDYVPTGSSQCSTVDPLGTTLSNTSWVARFKLTINDSITNPSSETNIASIGFFANNGAFGSGNEDSIVMAFWNNSSGSKEIRLGYTNNSFPASLTDKVTFTKQMAVETLYIELVRISDTSCKASLYEDSGYSSLIESQTLSISPGVCTNLRYFGGKNWNRSALNGNHDIDVDDLYIWNNTSTSPLLPKSALTNVQVGSRFEETDTRKMYNYVVPSITFQDDFSSDNWTDNDSTNIGVSGGALTWSMKRDGTNDASVRDLTSTSDDWVLRFKVTQGSSIGSTGAGNGFFFGISDSDESVAQNASQDFVGMAYYYDNQSEYNAMDCDGTALPHLYQGDAGQNFNITANDVFYFEIIKNGSSYTVEGFTNSDYSTGSWGKISGTTTATGLRYLKIMNELTNGSVPTSTNPFDGTIDDIKFYDGFTQTTSFWQEIGT